MLELDVHSLLLGNAGHVHQARAVGTRDESRTSLHVTLYFVDTHLLAHGRLLYGEHAAETAALIGALGLQHLDALHQIQQVFYLVELADVLFAGRAQPQLSDTMTRVVQTDLMREGAQRMVHLHDIVQEFDDIHRLLGSHTFVLAFQQARIVDLS